MIRRLGLIALAALGGCTFAFGSPYVGQHRAQEVVEFEVCVENDAGECEQQATMTKELPDRKFWGFAITYPMLGVAYPTLGGEQQTALRGELSMEYLRGKGRFAVGLRQSAIIDLAGENQTFVTAPLTAIAHLGINERLAVYGGAGFSWYNSRTQYADEMLVDRSVSHAGGRILGGLQLVGSRSHRNSRLIYSFEADSSLSSLGGQTYRSHGFTLSFGLFL